MKGVLGNPIQIFGLIGSIASILSLLGSLPKGGILPHIGLGLALFGSFFLYALGSVRQARHLAQLADSRRALEADLVQIKSVEAAARALLGNYNNLLSSGEMQGYLDSCLLFLEKFGDHYSEVFLRAKTAIDEATSEYRVKRLVDTMKAEDTLREACHRIKRLLEGMLISESTSRNV
jgi:hypothetical protein